MSTPALEAGAALDDFYESLPQHYLDADASLDYPLYRWVAGVLSVFGEVAYALDRIDYDPEVPELGTTSDLADPVTADVGWLPWIAQLVGVPLQAGFTEAEARDAVRFASAGWRAGTKTAVADAAKSELTGTRFARVYDHSVTEPGDGGMWDVLIVTRTTETPDVPAVLTAVERRGAKPAGVVLHHRAYEASWDTVVATYNTWSAIEAAGSWQTIQEAGL